MGQVNDKAYLNSLTANVRACARELSDEALERVTGIVDDMVAAEQTKRVLIANGHVQPNKLLLRFIREGEEAMEGKK